MKTVVLLHGLWMTPSSLDLFRENYECRGYRVIAPAWPRLEGDVRAMRKDPSLMAGLGVTEITDHYDLIIRQMDDQPILIGHCFGGLVVQMLLDRGLGSAGVAVAAPPPRGIFDLPISMIRSIGPMLTNPRHYWQTVMPSFEQFVYAFANTMSVEDAREFYDTQIIPSPGRPIFQTAFANFFPHAAASVNHRNYKRAPLLLITGTHDHFAPGTLNEKNFELYRHSPATTDFAVFADRSHLIVAQPGWKDVADYAISWVERRASAWHDPRNSAKSPEVSAHNQAFPNLQVARSIL